MTDRGTSGGGGMGAILGMIAGVLIVGFLIFYFVGSWSKPKPAPAKTGQAAVIVLPA